MNSINATHPPLTDHATPAEVSAEVVEATGAGLRIVEVAWSPSPGC
jgi:hypothetical protein